MIRARQAFLLHLEREKGASPHTIRAYGKDLEQLDAHLRQQLGREAEPDDVDVLAIRGFLAWLHGRGCSRATASRHARLGRHAGVLGHDLDRRPPDRRRAPGGRARVRRLRTQDGVGAR